MPPKKRSICHKRLNVSSNYNLLNKDQKKVYHQTYSQLKRTENKENVEHGNLIPETVEKRERPPNVSMAIRSHVVPKRTSQGRPPIGDSAMSHEEQVERQSVLDERRRTASKKSKRMRLAANKRWNVLEDPTKEVPGLLCADGVQEADGGIGDGDTGRGENLLSGAGDTAIESMEIETEDQGGVPEVAVDERSVPEAAIDEGSVPEAAMEGGVPDADVDKGGLPKSAADLQGL